jgi:glycosyltransferase involved in cell wall biosynthesis
MAAPAAPPGLPPVDDLGRDEQDGLAGEAAQDRAPVPVGQLGVDPVEEVEVGDQRRVGPQVVADDLGLGEQLAQAGDGRLGVVGGDELALGRAPRQRQLEEAGARAVGGEPADAALAEQRVDRGGAAREPGDGVGGALPVGARGRQRERPARADPQRVPRVGPDQIVADEAAILPEVNPMSDGDSHNEDVTVVVACFEYGAYVEEAVASARSQGARVVLVDDGSTGAETLAALERLEAAGEAEVVRQANAGVCAARNAGLARVETRYSLVLDADDRLAPGALGALRAPLDEDAALGFAYGHMRMFGAWEGVLRMAPYDPYGLLYRHRIGLSALARREVFAGTGGFDAAFEQYEDWELWLHALEHGWRGRLVDRVVLDYRRHPGAASKLRADRRRYRAFYRRLRAKHAALYGRAGELAAESSLGRLDRAAHRWFWGPRPLPAAVEHAVQRALWERGAGAGAANDSK